MKIYKIRVVREDGKWFPEYMRHFFWRRWYDTIYREVGFQTHSMDKPVSFETKKEAIDYALIRKTVIDYI